ncbi:TPA: hypothetical protein DCR49_00860 [Candidatus Delongbacteria bacterium]|nr:MAG: hypothetical protein A2Y39_04220 [Candidatus Delongbacteria bacterium GWF2_40_14]HAQ60549.1 hypothetical protein [Candidatus Delongbacteria bacterium]
MERSKPDFKIFIPLGIVFIGAGVVFLRNSSGTGIALIAVGLSWVAIGYAKSKKRKDGEKK